MTQGEEFPYIWRWSRQHPERKGQRCRIVSPPHQDRDAVIEFPDGEQVTASRMAVVRGKRVVRA